ncbi:50S ribosomal protein L20 [bacterium]|nr:50S ribosomal protein L20 [bacterium]|tara:strand:- start:7549 stop:7908 length:360 start_codon:yes stop_codon:yes gene_type:complete
MPRVKRGTIAHKRRKKVIKQAKGFMWRRKSNFKAAKEALMHAWANSYQGRKKKKRDFRRLWQVRINAGARENGLSYSKFIHLLKKNKIDLDRKILADLAMNNPKIFSEIVKKALSYKMR